MVEAFVTEKPCFLEEPGWQELTRLSKRPDVVLQEQLFACQSMAPRILRDAQKANRGDHDAADVLSRAHELRNTMKHYFIRWWEGLKQSSLAPVERPSGDDVFPIAYWFPNTLLPGLLCAHHTVTILLNELFIDAGDADSEALILEGQAGTNEICKCVFQAQTRLLGSIYMPFWLRVAADACTPEQYPWIMSRWIRFRMVDGIWKQRGDAAPVGDP